MSTQRTHYQHAALSLLAIAIAIAMLWLLQSLTYSKDVTANARHQLADSTVHAIQQLQGPVTITAVVGPHPQQRQALTELVARYQQHNPLISLSFVNPETDPAKARLLDADPSGELIINGMQREQRLQAVSERALTGALRQLNREGDKRLAFVFGHDERGPFSDQADHWLALSTHLQHIGLISEELSLVTNPRIDPQIDVLILADPVRPYFPGEIAGLLEYVNQGGNLLWLTETPSNKTTGSGLKALELELGIEVLPGVVIDTASQQANAGSPDFVIINAFNHHPVTTGLTNPILLPQASALAVTPLAGQTLLPLLQTPESSWSETGPLQGAIQFDENSDETQGPLVLGITIERLINNKQQRMAIIGDADFASTAFLGNGANQAFAERLLLWLSGDNETLQFATQPAPDAQLNLSDRAILILSSIVLFALPACCLFMAAFVGWRRRR